MAGKATNGKRQIWIMDSWIHGIMGRTDGRKDGRTDGRTDGRRTDDGRDGGMEGGTEGRRRTNGLTVRLINVRGRPICDFLSCMGWIYTYSYKTCK